MEISEKLRTARATAGKTQEQIAFAAGMNVTQYNGYERGRSRPTPSTLGRLADALQIDRRSLSDENPTVSENLGRCIDNAEDIKNLHREFKNRLAGMLGLKASEIDVRIELRLSDAGL